MKRIYEPVLDEDGYRVLVERLWPRGMSKELAKLDAWEKEIAPSNALRRWYGHDPEKWEEFQERYERELEAPEVQEILHNLVRRGQRGIVTLLYASRAGEISGAAVLRRVLLGRISHPPVSHKDWTGVAARGGSNMVKKLFSTIEKIWHRAEDHIEEWRRQDQARNAEAEAPQTALDVILTEPLRTVTRPRHGRGTIA
jgi:uncharacterized protein YeaO (DUF488 family)